MSRRRISIALTFLLFLTSLTVVAQKKNDSKKVDDPLKVNVNGKKKEDPNVKRSRELENASRALRKWIDEDVSYIITGEERAAWKALKTDEERESFIESFWLR